jgi:nicotinamide riboside kinase
MRIYFVGSHATGKTTMSRYISNKYNLPMIQEVARQVLAEMECTLDSLRTDVEKVNNYQIQVFERQIQEENKLGNNFVSDRAFDNLAYAAEYTTVCGKIYNSQQFQDYINHVRKGMIFFLRPHISLLKEDGIRAAVDWNSVVRIDGMLKLLLEMNSIKYLPIETSNMQERVQSIDFVISNINYHESKIIKTI